ncbi:GNAT family N-acetyltransferase [Clostridium sp. Marseille-QA1073]
MIRLEKISKDNYRECLRLQVAEYQTKFVTPNSKSLAKAYVYYDDAIPLAVYYEDLMVGFILLRHYDEEKSYLIDQFMIDARYQGKGYGKQAMELVIEQIKSERKYPKIILCYIDGDEAAKRLYSGLGFYHTGEVDENEIIMCFDL